MNGEVEYIVIGENGKQYGPMTLELLKSLVRDERVGPTTQVWDSTTREWHEAQLIEELSEFFPGEETGEAPEVVAAEVGVPRPSGFSLASMWCGILSIPVFCCGGYLLAVLAIIFGVVGKSEERRTGYVGGQAANVGIFCGIVALVLTGFVALLFGPSLLEVLKNAFEQVRGA